MNTPITHTKRHFFTKTRISKALKSYLLLDIKEIAEGFCDAQCWTDKMRTKARLFSVELEDVEVRENLVCPAFFKLWICNIPATKHNVNILYIRYFFLVAIDKSRLSLKDVNIIINEKNCELDSLKIVLSYYNDERYGFCVETKCNIADENEMLDFYNRCKWNIASAANAIVDKINSYSNSKPIRTVWGNIFDFKNIITDNDFHKR